MTNNELKIYRFRYNVSDLTIEQATRIEEFEKFKEPYSIKYSLSEWEEWDFDFSTLREILSPKQLKTYEKKHRERLAKNEQSLRENDQQYKKHISFQQELLDYYEKELLPPIYKDHLLGPLLGMHTDKSKINFLRSEYQAFLVDRKGEILSTHFRHYRTFQPLRLEWLLLQLKRDHLVPNYQDFEYSMDEPTRAVASYLKDTITFFPEPLGGLIKSQFDKLNQFSKKISKKYFKPTTKGWHVTIANRLTEEEAKKHLIMTVILLDSKQYGYRQD